MTRPKRTDPPPVPPVSISEDESAGLPAPPSSREVRLILGGFAALSLLTLILLFPGFQIQRHTNAAEAALLAHDWEAARDHLIYITETYPKAWVRLAQLGRCHLELGETEKGLAALQRSLEIEPDQDRRVWLATGLMQLGDEKSMERARSLLAARIKQAPDDPEANYALGLLCEAEGKDLEAAYFFQGAASDPWLRGRIRPRIEAIRDRLLPNG